MTVARPDPPRTQATFAATLVDEWARCGVTDAVVAPGSRSTPLVLALAREPRLRLHVRLDERSAGFVGLGLGLATGRPTVVVTTSGTAAAHLHPAILEASHACVPLIACTADRPPELQDVRAAQTISQRGLFGGAVRLFLDPGVADEEASGSWRSLAARVYLRSVDPAGEGAGPVHLNLPFREPLVSEPGPLPIGRPEGRPWTRLVAAETPAAGLDELLQPGRKGMFVAGMGCRDMAGLTALAERLGWPVLADPRAWRREPSRCLVTCFDSALRHKGFAGWAAPDVVVQLGDLPASKVLGRFLSAATGAVRVVVGGGVPWQDPDSAADLVVRATVDSLTAPPRTDRPAGDDGWLAGWQRAEVAVDRVHASALDPDGPLSEPGIARMLYQSVPADSTLFVASSMPVRDLEWFAGKRADPPRVLANRGVNGIDGIVSTAAGVAMAAGAAPVYCLLGDLALLHDLSGLVWPDPGPPDLTLVVVDNAGGGIFSFLPQVETLDGPTFETLFGTPQRADIRAMAAAAGCEVDEIGSLKQLAALVSAPPVPRSGIRLLHVRTDRAANKAVHDELEAAVMAALDLVGF